MNSSQVDASPLATYPPPGGGYDEMIGPDGAVREHWSFIAESLDSLGLPELYRRREEARALLENTGVTYNVTDASGQYARPWSLDPAPHIISSGEWNGIEQGLIQRAALYELILRDIYGSQSLIQRGLIPAEAILAHPGFQRPCRNGPVSGSPDDSSRRTLLTMAVDLARRPDGSMAVIADRAQAPSGSGYALENRIVLSRTLPSLYRDAQVHRLAVYFQALRKTLASLAPERRGRREDEPRIVLLTPGPGSESYFEHAFLANYLGYTLVQGGDLTVRSGRVWIDTLDGREPVDVILRRLEDSYCDPLELRPDSLLGVPGLLQVAREGAVTIANPLGSGVLENPALYPYLPELSRKLLGQDLRLACAPTWWCGDPQQRQYVLDHLDDLILKPIAPRSAPGNAFPGTLTEAGRQEWRARIQAFPASFVGQEQLPLSTAPCLGRDGLEARPIALRSFAVAREDDYAVMAGGLARIVEFSENQPIFYPRSGLSKDVWVLASEPVRETSLIRTEGGALSISRAGGPLASRVADNLFWLGRYAERAEGVVRLSREALRQCMDLAAGGGQQSVRDALLQSLTHLTASYPGFVYAHPDGRNLFANPELEINDLVYNRFREGGVASTLQAALQAGRSIQDRLSDDAWRILNQLGEGPGTLPDPGYEPTATVALQQLEALILRLSAFSGGGIESMSRGLAWRFLDLGRRLERANTSLTLLRTLFGPNIATDAALLESLLGIKDSLRTYRRRYQTRYRNEPVLDLLLLDESNPQSVGYQLQALAEHAENLPRRERNLDARLGLEREARLVLEASTALRLAEPETLAPDSAELDPLMARLQTLLAGFSDALAERYFRHTIMPRQV